MSSYTNARDADPRQKEEPMARLKRVALQERSTEVADLIRGLIDSGLPIEQIATGAHVSRRTVYRWLNEGRAPHPAFLEALRKMGERDVHQEGGR
jgi:DNA invertase Pin-like site-specific DNA recombinase